MAFKTSDNGVNFLKSQEGCVLTAYKLQGETYYTIGYGHYGPDVYEGMTITEQQAEDLLRSDLSARFEPAVNNIAVSKFPNMNQNQFDALISYTYNRGEGASDGSNGLRQLIFNSNTLNEVSVNIVVYWGSAETYKDALIERRKREQALFNSGVTPDPDEPDEPDYPPYIPPTKKKKGFNFVLLTRNRRVQNAKKRTFRGY
jgi:GH24 family phage-related lysozyme (muramidase)